MEIRMSVFDLKDIFRDCKNYVSKDDTKGIFKMVQLVCENGICHATALDGFKIMKTSVPYKGDEGIMYIPIVKVPKGTDVIITDSESEITFDFLTEKQMVKKIEGIFPDTKRFFKEDEPKFRMAFDPKLMRDALNGFSDIKYVEIDFFSENEGIVIKSSNKQALVLPVRLKK